jgi:hypothetical protein
LAFVRVRNQATRFCGRLDGGGSLRGGGGCLEGCLLCTGRLGGVGAAGAEADGGEDDGAVALSVYEVVSSCLDLLVR